MSDISFGFQAAPASDVHKSDQALYRAKREGRNRVSLSAA